MPPKTRITKDLILQVAFDITQTEGIEVLNARYLAKRLECSTMPIFKCFSDMNALKLELKEKIDHYYDDFIHHYIEKENDLLTMSYAYVCFALKQRNLFGALFIQEVINTRTIQEVLQSSWNRETIEMTAKKYHLSTQESENLYRDIRFYSHGIATQIYGGNMILDEQEIYQLIHRAIEKFKI